LDFRVGADVANTSRETTLREILARLADPGFGTRLAADVFAATGGYTREPDATLARTMAEYGTWAASVVHPEDFAALTICTKYDWPYDRRTVDFVLDFLHGVEGRLDEGAARRLVDEVVASIADPSRLAPAE
jgi:hypothetical protein